MTQRNDASALNWIGINDVMEALLRDYEDVDPRVCTRVLGLLNGFAVRTRAPGSRLKPIPSTWGRAGHLVGRQALLEFIESEGDNWSKSFWGHTHGLRRADKMMEYVACVLRYVRETSDADGRCRGPVLL